MRLRLGSHIFFALIAAGAIVVGSGYSLFSFFESDSDSTAVSPSPETIRENFTFNDGGDTNLTDTKYYTVRFYSQYLGYPGSVTNQGSGTAHYTAPSGGNVSNGYSHYFGYFPEAISANASAIGGSLYRCKDQNGTYINCVEFQNVSTITQEMLQDIGAPLYNSGVYDNNGKPTDGLTDYGGWAIKFLSWLLVDSSGDGPDFYSRNRSDANGWSGNFFEIDGSFPISGFEIPNFNLSLYHYDKYAVDGVISLYPYISSGKEYSGGETKDAVSLQTLADNTGAEPNGKISDYCASLSNDFVYDPDLSLVENGISAYRLPGLNVTDPNDAGKVTIQISMDREATGSSWETRWNGLGKPGSYSYRQTGDDNYTEGSVFTFADVKYGENGEDSLPEGRYNIYLFVKSGHETDIDIRTDNEISEVWNQKLTGHQMGSGDFASILQRLDGQNIKPFCVTDLGATFIYQTETKYAFPWWFEFYTKVDIRDFVLVVEKSFDIKMLGGDADQTWLYDDASYDPSFNQIQENDEILNEYEAREIRIDSSKTTQLSIDGLGTLSLPGNYVGIAIDDLPLTDSRFTLQTVDLEYVSEVNPIVEPTASSGKETPTVKMKSGQTEYYFSKSKISSTGEYDYGNSVLTFQDICETVPGLAGEITLNNEPLSKDVYEKNKGLLGKLPIIRLPETGEYNLYLRFNYVMGTDGAVDALNIDVYAYRLHNIFVKIALNDSFGLGDNGYFDSSDQKNFYTSKYNFYILEKLTLDDVFVLGGFEYKLSEIMLLKNLTLSQDDLTKENRYALYDMVSGQYALPSYIEDGKFTVTKNHVFAWKKDTLSNLGWTDRDDSLIGFNPQQGAQA